MSEYGVRVKGAASRGYPLSFENWYETKAQAEYAVGYYRGYGLEAHLVVRE